jgi:hypothetical protein
MQGLGPLLKHLKVWETEDQNSYVLPHMRTLDQGQTQ